MFHLLAVSLEDIEDIEKLASVGKSVARRGKRVQARPTAQSSLLMASNIESSLSGKLMVSWMMVRRARHLSAPGTAIAAARDWARLRLIEFAVLCGRPLIGAPSMAHSILAPHSFSEAAHFVGWSTLALPPANASDASLSHSLSLHHHHLSLVSFSLAHILAQSCAVLPSLVQCLLCCLSCVCHPSAQSIWLSLQFTAYNSRATTGKSTSTLSMFALQTCYLLPQPTDQIWQTNLLFD